MVDCGLGEVDELVLEREFSQEFGDHRFSAVFLFQDKGEVDHSGSSSKM